MRNWWEREAQWERELAEDIDAELVSANRKRWTLGSKLFVIGALLLAIDWLWRLPRWVHRVVAARCRASRESSGHKARDRKLLGETTCT
jgi:hypothetical protein